jgi:hypothetical protein
MQSRVERRWLCHWLQIQQSDHLGRDAKKMWNLYRKGNDANLYRKGNVMMQIYIKKAITQYDA